MFTINLYDKDANEISKSIAISIDEAEQKAITLNERYNRAVKSCYISYTNPKTGFKRVIKQF